ncbi:DNA helicase IV [Photobacterium aquimaris]|uniref:DNA 3'-5' helicase n=1 Tax=Photobacterium aquimaris TaxID=512643 RepID=A0A2T3IRL5_9GAMM|nr:DNA helicase IV [Photobacterium aquimaris]OBU15224.1 DNA helicase IV [Photobacterium aquimaris]OBU23302.1 DNA helicase IV [Photobacterium aquimaris]PSU31000.1 DNA helicase IV [Photobacterium aquimaris]PSW01768.1 DNA helicase IV [Photobacterium aquimaris]
MQLSASRLAQWLVQGDYYSIALDGNSLVLDSQTTSDVISFDDWDGSVEIHRGVLWGALELTSSNQQYCWTVHGLPWHECKPFAAFLVRSYQDWAQSRVDKLDVMLPEMLQRIAVFSNKSGYLRHSEHHELHQFLNDSLHDSDLSPELAATFRPRSFEKISPWLGEHQAWVEEHNQQWLLQQSQKWGSWFDSFEKSPLNESQRTAALINQDYNLVLAGAGTGKTSVLVARAGYLIASQAAVPEDILMLSFGRKAAEEMTDRLKQKVSDRVKVATFHSLGSQIIRDVEHDKPNVASITLDVRARSAWLARMLIEQWNNSTAASKWQRHLTQWRVPGFSKENSMEQQAENEQLQAWVWRHIELLGQSGMKKDALLEAIVNNNNPAMRPRMKSELALLWPCYQAYLQHLKVKKQIDFNSMIEVATEYVKAGKFVSPWRYIMVDEYQDISPQRLALIEALCHQKVAGHTTPTLFAVGDDWQAIYHFAGADVNLTTDFKGRFGNSNISELSTTYRFNSMIGEVANVFIQQNPSQIKKQLTSFTKQSKKAVTLLATDLLPQELIRLSKHYENKNTNVLILGRNNKQKPEKFETWKTQWPQLNLEYMTCHSSKGREADYVFIVDVNKGIFPSPDRETGLAAIMQSSTETYNDAEERRLFYVALTRAKKHAWVCANPDKTSPFINELIEDKYPVNNKIKRTK